MGLSYGARTKPSPAEIKAWFARIRGERMTIIQTDDLPLVVELRPPPGGESALLSFSAVPHSLLLDSALHEPRLGRYSFLTADPFEVLTVPADQTNGFDLLEPPFG